MGGEACHLPVRVSGCLSYNLEGGVAMCALPNEPETQARHFSLLVKPYPKGGAAQRRLPKAEIEPPWHDLLTLLLRSEHGQSQTG